MTKPKSKEAKKEMTIIAIKCKKCNHIIWSRHRHDYRSCKCGAVAIDGGRDYTKVNGNQEDYETHSIVIPKDATKTSFVEFGKKCMEINEKNQFEVADWGDYKGIATKIALIHSELSEALEDARHNDFDNFVEEIADVLVRTYDLGAAINPNNFEEAFNRLALDLYIKIQINLLRGIKHSGGDKSKEKRF